MTSKVFKTVKEVKAWKSFIFQGQEYDLSHLNAHHADYIDSRNANNPITYKFIVTYSFHCFTVRDDQSLSSEEKLALLYQAPNESRPFNFERYSLSKDLPAIIRSLGSPKVLVFHAGYSSFATIKLLNLNTVPVDYFVPFKVFRESKKLRLHVLSAYPKEERIGKVQKVNFFAIAYNLLRNKPLPKPR